MKGRPFVRVATGRAIPSEGGPPQNSFLEGFLLRTNASSFDVMTTLLRVRTLTNTPMETPEQLRVGFETLSFQEEATARLDALRNAPAKDWDFPPQFSDRAEVFVLAWDCWRQGLDALAQDLYIEAKKIPDPDADGDLEPVTTANDPLNPDKKMPSELRDSEKRPTFQEALEKDIGHAVMWRAILAFEDTSISRPELLAQFEAIAKNYPHSEHHQRAQQTADLLKRMVAEDQEHAKNGPKDLRQLPVEDRVRELIFRLRDQTGYQWSYPGTCDIFDTPTHSTNTPAHQLLDLGYAAVPQLIAAMQSPTLTRSVGYWRPGFSRIRS